MSGIDGEIFLPGSKLGRGAGASPVNNIPKGKKVNRHALSPAQHQILNILTASGQPIGGKVGHLPRTGDIVDALGLPRTKVSFASVSRSLARLAAAGRIVGYSTSMATRGFGRHWGIKQ
ncbi:hypothetical protein ASD50_15155 [Mesorhizobium sp. Root552]|uniref:MarR family transcriptional regulator n=1 Tax=Mesorhizobium sp. Root552 TaxID=1736555 RepID=UPI0006F2DB32|nr:helix-turn-helix domain-containing protein [Mesorhizobium sp. Root552]KQZ31600.1 hypothetical protein ASD50_15155 [Mesorhizobium sp. Root552]